MRAPEVTDALTRALGGAFQHITITRQQARPHVFGLTVDEIDGCTRQAAYRIAATPPTDPGRALSGQERLTNLNHATGQTLLPALSHVLGADHHTPVTLHAAGLSIPGIVPLYWPTAAVLAGLTTTPTPATSSRQTTSPPDDPGLIDHPHLRPPRIRLTTAALGLAALQARLPVAWLAEINLSRGTGDSHVGIAPMTQLHEQVVERRAAALAHHASNPDQAPTEPRATDDQLNPTCARCPWLIRCWPDHPRTP